MTADEAERILKRIINTWPANNWTPGALTVWRKELREHDFTLTAPDGTEIDIARRTYDALKKHCTSKYGPTVGDWHNEYQANTPRPEWQPTLDSEPVVTPERMRQLAAEARNNLTGRRFTTQRNEHTL